MDVLTCKNCKGTSSAQHIRCSFCGTVLISVGNSNNVVHHSRRPPSPLHIQCYGGELVCSLGDTGNANDVYSEPKEWSQEFTKKKSEAKLLCHNLRKRFPFSNMQQSQTWVPPLATSLTDQPLRGKRAFLCGVSYKKQKHELKRTAQDVRSMRDLLVQAYGFPTESILILAEEEPYYLPTKKNIEDAFKWLIRGIQSGDSLVFYFSGHGIRQFINRDNGWFDETICPVDFEKNGMIFDTDINAAIVRPLIKHVILHVIIDSSQGGPLLDLPLVYDINMSKWENNRPLYGAYRGTNGGMVICFSACEDNQLAADTYAFSPDKEMAGAMTIAFINAIKASLTRNEKITYQGIMDSMHQSIKQTRQSGSFFAGIRRGFHRRILQDPLLSSSKEFNTSIEFEL